MSEQVPSGRSEPIAFGLIVVGDEVLNGERVDRHLPAFKGLLSGRGHELAWYWLLPDNPAILTRQIAVSMAGDTPVFCCGGIGATPDDHTRACAAAAAGVPLQRHAEAERLIVGQFGAAARPYRILMADLPAGSTLIPNPTNNIPGFALHRHWFLPGFPQMAWPMAEWVLDTRYAPAPPLEERALEVRGVPESALIPLMRRVQQRFPALKLFSLPHMGQDPHILLGVRGHAVVADAMVALRSGLDAEGMRYRLRD
jgi:molybdopterin-biosynthesis enzyme MoeA-like protein